MTQQSRMERNLAHMDILVGRLEKALASLPPQVDHPEPPVEPPFDLDAAQKAADEYLEQRKFEMEQSLLGEPDAA
jgi:hypothetical protein